MMEQRSDPRTQLEGCRYLGALTLKDAGNEVSPAMAALDEAATAAVQGPFKNMDVANACIDAQLQNLRSNRPLSIVLLQNTRVFQNMIKLMKDNANDAEVQERWLNSFLMVSDFAPEITSRFINLGGLEIMFSVIDSFVADPNLLTTAWKGLADLSRSDMGAFSIAHQGGAFNGLKFMVNQMQSPHVADLPSAQFKDEIMYSTYGLLQHDPNNTFRPMFVKMGMPKQILVAMKEQPKHRPTHNMGCACLKALTRDDPITSGELVEEGIIELLTKDLATFYGDDPNPQLQVKHGITNSVIPDCSEVLANIGHANNLYVVKMLDAGMPEQLARLSADPEMDPDMQMAMVPIQELMDLQAAD